MSTRRRFLQLAGAGAVFSTAAARMSFAQATASAPATAPLHNRSALPFVLGIASYSFRKFPLEQALAMTARLGIKKICLKSMHLPLDATPETIAQALAKAKAAGVDIYGGGVIYMSTPAKVAQAFDYAKAAGMRVIVGVPNADLLPLVNEKVKQYDIRVAIHNHGPGDKHYARAGDAYEKVKKLDPRIGLCIDVGHTARSGEDPAQVIEQCADRLYDVHMKDEFAATKAGDTVEIGRGVMDIPSILRALVKVRYAHVAAFEFDAANSTDPLPGVAESVGYVRGVLDTI